jgi:glycosyltransferase involved in cell wall biosynthesis
LCEPGNVKDLADAVETLLVNPAQAQALGIAGQKVVFERFTAGAMARETLKVFDRVAQAC